MANAGTLVTPTDTTFEKECVLFFADIVQVFGVPKSVGQIYGLLYASPTPLGFADIVERLEISKGSASQGLQVLRDLGAIVEAERPSQISNLGSGTKRSVVYEPELSLRQLIAGTMRERIVPIAISCVDRLQKMRAAAGQTSINRDFCTLRIEKLEKWRKRINAVLPSLLRMLGNTSVRSVTRSCSLKYSRRK